MRFCFPHLLHLLLIFTLCTFLISRQFEASAVIRFICMEFPSLPTCTNLFNYIVDLAFLTCPGIDPASTRNEYQEYLLSVKAVCA